MKDNEMYLHKVKEEERKRKDRNEMVIKDNLELMRLKKEGMLMWRGRMLKGRGCV